MRFLDGITATRKEELLGQLRAVWTHDSTALEGNALSLGDTMFVLQYGLTVKGKPLKDQLDVQNHARAVDRVMSICERGSLCEEDVFDLHRLVINEQSFDICKPVARGIQCALSRGCRGRDRRSRRQPRLQLAHAAGVRGLW